MSQNDHFHSCLHFELRSPAKFCHLVAHLDSSIGSSGSSVCTLHTCLAQLGPLLFFSLQVQVDLLTHPA